MPISPYYKPQTASYTSQFVQEKQPYDLMLKAGQQRQSQIDEVRDLASETRSKLSIDADPRLTGSYALAKQREKQYEQALEEDLQEFYETGNVRRAARKLSAISNKWQEDPVKKEVERQSQRFREDIKTYRNLAQKGKNPVNKWMQNGEYVSGITQEGLYQPTVGVKEGITSEDARKMFEEKMDIEKTRTITKQGKKINYRAKPDMFEQVGLNEQGKLTDKGKDTFQQWLNDLGRDRLIDYMRRSGIVSDDSSIEQVNKAVRNFYERTAREVASRYEDYDITKQIEDFGDDVEPFGSDGTFQTGEKYNYRLPGFETVLGTSFLNKISTEADDTKKKLAKQEIKQQISGDKDMTSEVQTIMSIQNELAKKGIFDSDAIEEFGIDPVQYNYGRLKEILDKASRGISISEEEAKLAKDLIGPNMGLGKRQTVNEVQDELVYTSQKERSNKPNIAQKALDRISKIEGKHYQKKVREKKPESVENPQGWGIPYKEQSRISNLNFGRTEVIDAEKGIQITGDYIDRGDVKPRRIVSLPLVKVDGKWVDYTKEENSQIREKLPADQLGKKLFIEAAGKIDPTNLEPESRLQMFAASNENIDEKTPLDTQFEKKKDEILKSDKMLIYVNDAMKQQILNSVESEPMQNLFQNYQLPTSDVSFGPSDVQSENL